MPARLLPDKCRKGHVRTDENTAFDQDGYRYCRECRRVYSRAYFRLKREDPAYRERQRERHRELKEYKRKNIPGFREHELNVERARLERRRAAMTEADHRARSAEHHRSKLKKYGLTPADYNDLLARQSGVCGICGKPPNGKALGVDHCHESGRVRGLLCNDCNIGIGKLGDTAEGVQRALRYLSYIDHANF